jgi:hypothetical protein
MSCKNSIYRPGRACEWRQLRLDDERRDTIVVEWNKQGIQNPGETLSRWYARRKKQPPNDPLCKDTTAKTQGILADGSGDSRQGTCEDNA